MIKKYQDNVDVLFYMTSEEIALRIRQSVKASYFIPLAPSIGWQWSGLRNIDELMEELAAKDFEIELVNNQRRLNEYRETLKTEN